MLRRPLALAPADSASTPIRLRRPTSSFTDCPAAALRSRSPRVSAWRRRSSRRRVRTSASAKRNWRNTWPRLTTICAPSTTSIGWRRASANRSTPPRRVSTSAKTPSSQREEPFRKRLNEELETQLRQARREIDEVIADLQVQDGRDRPATPRRGGGRTGETGAVRSDARAAVEAVATALCSSRRQPLGT